MISSVVRPTATYWAYARELPKGFPDHPQKEWHPLKLDDPMTQLGLRPSIEEARQALVALVEQQHDAALDANLSALRDGIALIEPEGVVMLSAWRCDLEHKTFVYALAHPPVFMQLAGTFLRGVDGHWQARVTREERN